MNLNNVLSPEEHELLNSFLLDRIEEDAETAGKDEGIHCISELDGFLTAIVSGPNTLVPSQWLPAIWADFEPAWTRLDDVQTITFLIMRHLNGIVTTLMSTPEEFKPIFNEYTIEGRTVTIVGDWCEGYMRGVRLSGNWGSGDKDVENLLSPIRDFTEDTSWAGDELEDPENRIAWCASIAPSIAPNARAIHAYWITKRTMGRSASHRSAQRLRAGRNDPCPCGSGKKFKKCCLH